MEKKDKPMDYDVIDTDGNVLATEFMTNVLRVKVELERVTGKTLKIEPTKPRERRHF